MQLLLLTVATVSALMAIMAVGVVLTGKELRGSCGGVAGKFCLCDAEGRPRECEQGKAKPPEAPDLVPLTALGRRRDDAG